METCAARRNRRLSRTPCRKAHVADGYPAQCQNSLSELSSYLVFFLMARHFSHALPTRNDCGAKQLKKRPSAPQKKQMRPHPQTLPPTHSAPSPQKPSAEKRRMPSHLNRNPLRTGKSSDPKRTRRFRPVRRTTGRLLRAVPGGRPADFPQKRPENARKAETFPPPLDSRHRDIKTYRNSQGGVQVPTGGEPPNAEAARGRVFKGKAQIRCKSGADGNSPEERERILRLSRSEAFSSLLAPFAALMWTSQGVCHASAIFSLHH